MQCVAYFTRYFCCPLQSTFLCVRVVVGGGIFSSHGTVQILPQCAFARVCIISSSEIDLLNQRSSTVAQCINLVHALSQETRLNHIKNTWHRAFNASSSCNACKQLRQVHWLMSGVSRGCIKA